MARIRVGVARVPDRESPDRAIELVVQAGYDACEIDFEGGFWMDYPWAERAGRGRPGARRRALGARTALRVGRPPRGERAQVGLGARGARPLRRDRRGLRRGGRRVPPRVPPRSHTRGCDRERRRAARARASTAGGQGPGRAVRRRGDGARARPRLARGLRRDRGADRLGATCVGLRAHARDERRRLPRRGAVPRRARARRRRAAARRPLPHPLLGHRLREPQRDAAPPLRRGHAPRGSAP